MNRRKSGRKKREWVLYKLGGGDNGTVEVSMGQRLYGRMESGRYRCETTGMRRTERRGGGLKGEITDNRNLVRGIVEPYKEASDRK